MKLKRFRIAVHHWTLEEMEMATKKKAPPFSILDPKQDRRGTLIFDIEARNGADCDSMCDWICRHHDCDQWAVPQVWEKT